MKEEKWIGVDVELIEARDMFSCGGEVLEKF